MSSTTNRMTEENPNSREDHSVVDEHESLPELFLRQAETRPDDIAVVEDGRTMTFAELSARGSHLAERLRSAGVGTDDVVGLYLTPSAGLVTATWGVLLAGAAYLPLAPDYPEERISYMVRDSRVRVVITESGLRDGLADLLEHDVSIITLDEIGGTSEAERFRPRMYRPGGSDAAYIIYTSGTTGRPKGVVIEHRAIASQMAWLRDSMGIDEGQVVLRKTPISFDAAQWEVLSLAVGSRVVVGPPGVHRDPSGLIQQVIENDVTVLQCVPTLLQALVDDDLFERCTSLTRVFSGGEALPRRLAARVREVLPGCELINLYGPTECTINASSHVVTARDLEGDQYSVPIGKPVDGVSFHVLDDRQQPVAPSGTGELYIGGVQLARGYLHRDEETAARFVHLPLGSHAEPIRLYRTGDLVTRRDDGSYQFVGRVDNQVKLRGYRVELDEIRVAIENHDWVKNAAVVVSRDDRTGAQSLVACVELNPREAALMDQGNHGAHHQSKQSRLQVRAQLANLGLRADPASGDETVVALPGKAETRTQRRRAFARKTYRFFEGPPLCRADLIALLSRNVASGQPSTPLDTLDLGRLGEILRYFGQFHSADRILPKYAYASPGALYATQLYVEFVNIPVLRSGYYYYHPVRHELILIRAIDDTGPEPRITCHFLGKRPAIEAVYRNNVLEVLWIEAGHMLGLLDEILPEYGLAVGAGSFDPTVAARLDVSDDHHYLAGYEIVPSSRGCASGPLDTYVQVHPGKVTDLDSGQYRYQDGDLHRISDALLLRKHVIAINQEVYERAGVGISLISRSPDVRTGYIELGRRLQILQMNPFGMGFMSSGYSSETGNDLPAARRFKAILHECGLPSGPFYFFLGGRVSEEQILSEGMKEDSVHTLGPAEMIKRDIAGFLPHYMIPSRVIVLDSLPYSANGKVDIQALTRMDVVSSGPGERVVIAPRTKAERQVAEAWAKVMKTDDVSVRDDFFEVGGNSLLAVLLIQQINRATGAQLPLQLIFDETTIEGLARRVDSASERAVSRLVSLQPAGQGRPVICWPGLGGYPMNLKPLARAMGTARPFYGVQATGINSGETPYGTIAEMARHDVTLIKQLQPSGPYTLWGYSFGARVAFETAHQLEAQGDEVDHLLLIAPGSPVQSVHQAGSPAAGGLYGDPAFVALLYSVFAGRLTGPDVDECVASTRDEASFVDFVAQRYPELDTEVIGRIVAVVRASYSFRYTFEELLDKQVKAPITILKAKGDDYSFLEGAVHSFAQTPTMLELDFDHYSMLRPPYVQQLAAVIREQVEHGQTSRVDIHPHAEAIHMPHVTIKHFPVQITPQKQEELVAAISTALQKALGCNSDAVSIAMEPVAPADWHTEVYQPEIEGRAHLLCKAPKY